ncbi:MULTISPECIES: hypothetical protein [unclassified Psychrobacter]|uniref:hypothetical protein n=1 Tax=unclassified Psychrobacter TaxID=196806 RepID=UPI00071E83CD|nr:MULTISPECIES: hypothetical protein [unclassified Psychrobacter]OLF39050.1 hypothetical protein BTV98_01095 [Psychrobacter sp. Cmf 22.2]
MNKPTSPVQNDKSSSDKQQKRSLVPKGITIGLAVFSLILSLAGYGFRLMLGEDVGNVLRHAAMVVPAFVLGIPLLFWFGARVFNKVNGTNIAGWNAISLGYLTSCIAMLWLMGTYS